MDPEIFKSRAPVLIYQFKWPKTKKVDFAKLIATGDQATKDNLAALQEARDELVAILATKDKIARQVLQAVERYLPYLYSLVVSVENAKGKLRLTAPMGFAWSSALAKDARSSTYHQFFDVQFEAMMVCLTYAFAHINRASELTIAVDNEGFEEAAASASTLLRTAAGIFEYVQERELPRWKDLPEERPLEITGPLMAAMSSYCCSMAQALAVKKALLGGTTSRQLMAKLQTDVWNKQALFEKTMRALPAWADDKIQVIFKSFIGLQVNLAKATAYKYAGEDLDEKEKHGHAVAFLQLAGDALKTVWVPAPRTLLARYAEEIQLAKDDIEHIFRKFKGENDGIYMLKVPIEAELDMPEPRSLVEPEAWMPARPVFEKIK